MTSASCIVGKKEEYLQIGAGSDNIKKQKKCKKIIHTLVHPKHTDKTCKYNLAVVVCETNDFHGPGYKKVSLPREPEDEIGSEPGYSVGLGKPQGFDLKSYKVALKKNCVREAALCCSKDCDYVGDGGHGLSIDGKIVAIRCEIDIQIPLFTSLYDKKNQNYFSSALAYAKSLKDTGSPGLINISIGK